MRQVIVAVTLALAAGCGRTPTMIPVTGLVKIDHQPAAGVLVYFWPVVSTKDNFGYRHAVGITDDRGHFFLKCSRDGLLGIEGGDYRVTFSRPVDPPPVTDAASAADDKGKRRKDGGRRVESVPLPYSDHADPKNSPSLVTVSRSSDKFTFDLPAR